MKTMNEDSDYNIVDDNNNKQWIIAGVVIVAIILWIVL